MKIEADAHEIIKIVSSLLVAQNQLLQSTLREELRRHNDDFVSMSNRVDAAINVATVPDNRI